MKRCHKIKGFTLLELIVVFAIIGVLVSIVFVSLDVSKQEGIDAGVKKNLSNAAPQAEVFYINQTRTYEGVCTDATLGILRHVQRAAEATGATASINDNADMATNVAVCHDSVDGWAAGAPLKGGGAWCIDSTKVATTTVIGALNNNGDITCN